MLKEFVECEIERYIEYGFKCIRIDNINSNDYLIILDDLDNLKDVFIIQDINNYSFSICQLTNGGYNILYKIRINIQEELKEENIRMRGNIREYKNRISIYLSDIIDDNLIELYHRTIGGLLATIDIIFDRISNHEIDISNIEISEYVGEYIKDFDVDKEMDNRIAKINDKINNIREKFNILEEDKNIKNKGKVIPIR